MTTKKELFDALQKLERAAADLSSLKVRTQSRWLALGEAQREAAIVIAKARDEMENEPVPAPPRPPIDPTFNLRALI